MAERLGEALLELRTDDKGFRAGVAGAKREADGLGKVMETTTARADRMGDELGTVGVALRTMGGNMRFAANQNRQLAFQMIDLAQGIPLAFQSPIYGLQNFGFQIAQIGQLYMGQGGMRAALRDMVTMTGRFAAKMGPVLGLVALLGAGIAGMTHEINASQSVIVGFGDVMIGVFQTIGDGLKSLFAPVFPVFASAWELIVNGARTAGNLIINSFRAAAADVSLVARSFPVLFADAYAKIKTHWQQLPGALGDVVFSAANRVVAGTEAMVNGAIERIMALNDMLPDWARSDTIANMGRVELGQIGNPFAGLSEALDSELEAITQNTQKRLGDLWSGRESAIAGIMSSDPLDAFYQRVKQHAIGNAQDDGKKSKASEADKMADRYDRLTRSAKEFIAEQELERQVLGMSTRAANALRYEHELLNEAKRADIALTPQQTAELKILAQQMAEAEAETGVMADNLNFRREVFRGFFADMRAGAQNGKKAWEVFRDAGLNALDRLTDRIFNQALDAVDQLADSLAGLGSGGSKGGGGFLGGLGNVIGGLFSGFFADGGLIPNGSFGIVGEAGPEPVFGTSSGAAVLPNSALSSMAGARDSSVTLYVIGEEGKFFAPKMRAVAEGVAVQVVSDGIGQYDNGLAGRISDVMERNG